MTWQMPGAVATLLSLSAPAALATEATGIVDAVTVTQQGDVYVALQSPHVTGMPCKNKDPKGYVYTFSLKQAGTKKMLDTILTVHLNAASVVLTGTGTCNSDQAIEGLSAARLAGGRVAVDDTLPW